jgi:hypothetical protein
MAPVRGDRTAQNSSNRRPNDRTQTTNSTEEQNQDGSPPTQNISQLVAGVGSQFQIFESEVFVSDFEDELNPRPIGDILRGSESQQSPYRVGKRPARRNAFSSHRQTQRNSRLSFLLDNTDDVLRDALEGVHTNSSLRQFTIRGRINQRHERHSSMNAQVGMERGQSSTHQHMEDNPRNPPTQGILYTEDNSETRRQYNAADPSLLSSPPYANLTTGMADLNLASRAREIQTQLGDYQARCPPSPSSLEAHHSDEAFSDLGFNE